MRRWLVGCLTGWIAGCTDSSKIYFFDPPELASGSAALLGVADDRVKGVVVWDASAPVPKLQLAEEVDEIQIYFKAFPKPLAAYGYDSGRLLADPGGQPLPPTDTVWERHVSVDTAGEWSPSLSTAIVDDFRASRALPCETLRPVLVPLSMTAEEVYFLAGLPDGRVLLQVRDGRFFRVDSAADPEPLPALGTTLATGVYLDRGGELWLAFEGGQVRRGSIETGFVPVAARTSTLSARLTGPPADSEAPFELYAFDVRGRLERFVEGAWTVVYDVEAQVLPATAVWVGPGEVIFGGPFGHGFRLKDNRVVRLDRALEISSARIPAHTLFAAPGLGSGLAMVADDLAGYLEGESRVELPPTGLPRGRAWGAGLGAGGILVGGPSGNYRQWWSDRGYCPTQSFDAEQHAFGQLTPIAGGFVTSQRLFGGGERTHLLFLFR